LPEEASELPSAELSAALSLLSPAALPAVLPAPSVAADAASSELAADKRQRGGGDGETRVGPFHAQGMVF
jgi:hypothetical protein